MENGPFIDDFPSYKPPFRQGIFQFAMLNNQMVMSLDLLFVVSRMMVACCCWFQGQDNFTALDSSLKVE
jgi:hypothetical protein